MSDLINANSNTKALTLVDISRARDIISNHPVWAFPQFYAANFPKYYDATGQRGHQCPECEGPLEVNPTQGKCYGKCTDNGQAVKEVWDLYRLARASAGEPLSYRQALTRMGAQLGFTISWDKLTADQLAKQRATITAALTYAARGWRVFPCHHMVNTPVPVQQPNGTITRHVTRTCSCEIQRKKKDITYTCASPGKHPIPYQGVKEATTDRVQILEWWTYHPEANLAVATGVESNLWVLDVDGDEGYDNLRQLEEQYGELPTTITAITGSGGLHYFFSHPTDATLIRGSVNSETHIDVRGYENYVVVAPSNHKSGNVYQWEASGHPDEVDLAPAPDWLIKLVTERNMSPKSVSGTSSKTGSKANPIVGPSAPPRSFADILKGVPEGERDRSIFRFACSRLARGISISEIESLVLIAASQCTPPFPEDQARVKLASAIQTHRSNNPHWTDPDYNPEEMPDVPEQPATHDEAATIVNEMIAELRAAKKNDVNVIALFTPERIAAAERVRTENNLLDTQLNLALKPHGLVKKFEKELKKRQFRIVPSDGEAPVKTVGEELSKLSLTAPEGAAHLLMPGTHTFTERGIEILEKRETGLVSTLVAPGIMFPVTRLQDVNTGEIQYSLVFLKNQEWKLAEFPKRVLTDKTRLSELADYDCEMGSAYTSMTSKYNTDFLALNANRIPTVSVSSQNGWTDKNDAYLCGTETISASNVDIQYRANRRGMAQIAAAFNKNGSLDEWKRVIERVRNFCVVMCLLNTGFTGPLLKILDMGSVVVDLFGTTSRGKTSAARFPASIWGKPVNSFREDSAGIMRSWRTTDAALENEAYQCNDAALILDDSKDQSRPDLLQPMIYMVAGGAGKARMSRDGGRRPTLTWRVAAISTGECALTDYAIDGGAHARIVPIDAAPFGPNENTEMANFVDNLKSDLLQNYGHAGPVFVRWLMDNKSEWPVIRAEFEARRNELAASTTTGAGQRIAAACAAISIAGKLAHNILGFPWSFDDPVEHLWPAILARLSNIHTHRRAFLEIRDWLYSNRGRFVDPMDDTATRTTLLENYGLWSSTTTWDQVAIIPQVLRDELKRRHYASPDAIIKEWVAENWLNTDPGRELKRVQFRNDRHQYVVIRRDALERDFDAKNTDNPETDRARAALQNLVESLYECLPFFEGRERAN